MVQCASCANVQCGVTDRHLSDLCDAIWRGVDSSLSEVKKMLRGERFIIFWIEYTFCLEASPPDIKHV